MRYAIDVAGPTDDAGLRALLAETPMAGAIAVAFAREPSYFGGGVVEGPFRQTLVAREAGTGRIVACGTRSVALRYVNGEATGVGYLGGLRIAAGHRGRGLLARGYRRLGALHGDGRAAFYLTTIAEDNAGALGVLTSGRAGLPTYRPAGRFLTAVLTGRSRRGGVAGGAAGLSIRPATEADRGAVAAFLTERGRGRQFFPCYGEADVFAAGGMLHGLLPGDLLLAYRGGVLVGTLGAWDQGAFRQTIVRGYEGVLRYGRAGYNAWARVRGLPRLPAVGQALACRMGALPLTAEGEEGAFGALLEGQLARLGGGVFLAVGLHEADPLLGVLRGYRARWYTTAVFVVDFGDGAARFELDGRRPYLELGAL